MPKDTLSRRMMLVAPVLLTACSDAKVRAEAATSARPSSKTLVACFTRSGNTQVIAGSVQRALGADLFHIRPRQPYPDDYEQTVEQARQERDRGYAPPLDATVADIALYEIIYLAFSIWGETAPPVIRSFLKAHDLSGKTLRPLITHGGYGLGNSLAVLADHAPGARIEAAFSMEADQERRTLTTVKNWLSEKGYS